MIAEEAIREALDLPTPEEFAKREELRAHTERLEDANWACCVAEGVLYRAKQAKDTRAIHAAEKAFTAAKHALLAIETGRA
jgi:hypothetical protein